MERLHQVLLASNASIESIEHCSLPYVFLPSTSTLNNDCYIDIFYILDGTGELMFNKLPIKELSKGDFILLKRENSDYFILSGHADTVVIHAKILPRGLYLDLVMYHGYHESLKVLRKECTDVLYIAAEMMKLLLCLKNKGTQMNRLIEIPMALFFVQLYVVESSWLSLSSYNSEHKLSNLMLEIIKNPCAPWRVKDMAKKYNMSTNFFIDEFRKLAGVTPFVFLKKTRLNRGRKLLENTEKPVSIIARECGYNSHASFAYYIKKEFGFPPLKIRRNAKINIDSISPE
ncbi:TPA: helix-turn-helix transcriptional regulator, partial [Salmonella enterica subsp. diarizonae serovar 60-67:z35:-]